MAFGQAVSGAGSGAATGAAIGSVVPGVGTAIGAVAGGLLGGLGGIFGRSKPKETRIQKQQRQLVDQLIGSLKGQGPYSNLFTANQADFEKSFAEPARARFRNITAPQIQQQYIASGQQRGTGLEDTLTRAGVDMDQLLNQNWMQYVQGKEANQAAGIGQILNQGPGVAPKQSLGSAAAQGIGGYLSSGGSQDIGNIIGSLFNKPPAINAQSQNSLNDTYRPLSKGYVRQNQVYNPYTGIQE